MKDFLIIGNWKMNKTYTQTLSYLDDLVLSLKELNIPKSIKVGIAAPYPSLPAFTSAISKFVLPVAQNMSIHQFGAFTGEVSALMLNDLNVRYVILGHNERRLHHFETNERVNVKAKIAIEHGITPLICVGESLEDYQNNKTKEIIKQQVLETTKGLDLDKFIIAYEPIWATGTGHSATPEFANEICGFISQLLDNKVIVQYGGSVTSQNIEQLCAQPNINGFLVGKASLQLDNFIEVIKHTLKTR
ncbi:triose-phosphate isomerase [Mycoplasma sp. 4404]|uniref:triose-phosphate isomerase n=1 Tax=Mycoplasma sp. 4404 TaxID=3108530 RepID=UPI002B1D2537|nr:triose-phosphate isomerase [Mycoplasma sp. 4404]MEA4162401.1 triose-phosphate isomerase [Mycoplasma sp. 4404]